ncbi:hypothetical protein BH24CHL10_BH24CHL10_08870 [soil metagenome]
MELMRHLGMEPVMDLFHFGVPEWLSGVAESQKARMSAMPSA